jgi:hypothetical protein
VPAVVPWIPKSPPALVRPALAPACKAANLRVTHSPIFTDGLAGSGFAGSVLVRNAGPPCSLLARPRLRFTGGPSSRMRQLQQPLTPDLQPAADPLPPPFSMRAVPTGKTVWLAVAWRSWCAPGNRGGGAQSPPPTTFDVTLPSGGTLHFFPGGTPVCFQPPATSVVQSDLFRPYVPPGAASSAIPLKASFAAAPAGAVRGATLRYRVTLANQTGIAYRFGKTCPVYVEQVGTAKNLLKERGTATELHYLNCRGVVVGAHSSVTFAMELRIPKSLRSADLLEWQLAPHSYEAPFVATRVRLT